MEKTESSPTPTPDESHLLDRLIVLARHSRVILGVSAAVTVFIFLILLILPNKYKATATLLPPQQSLTLSSLLLESTGISPKPGLGAAALGGMGGMLGLKSPGLLYIGILQGNTIFDRIIEKFKLRKVYKEKKIEDTRKVLTKYAKISAGREGLITIDVIDKNPKRAAAMANAFWEELNKLLQETAGRQAEDYLAFLEKERSQAAANLTKAEETMRKFSEQTSLLQVDAQTKRLIEYVASLRAKIDAKEVQIQVMRQQATPTNYDVIKLETELNGLKDKLKGAETQADSTCDGDVCIATSKMPALGMEYFRRLRETKYQEEIYRLYVKLAEMARMEVGRNVNTLQVIDIAIPPEKRANKRVLPSLLAGILSFFMMIGLVLWREHWQVVRHEKSEQVSALITYLQPYKIFFLKLSKYVRLKKPE